MSDDKRKRSFVPKIGELAKIKIKNNFCRTLRFDHHAIRLFLQGRNKLDRTCWSARGTRQSKANRQLVFSRRFWRARCFDCVILFWRNSRDYLIRGTTCENDCQALVFLSHSQVCRHKKTGNRWAERQWRSQFSWVFMKTKRETSIRNWSEI